VVTVCEKAGSHSPHGAHDRELSPETIMEIKGAVARYLPGMLDSHVSVTHSHSDCTGAGHACPTAQLSKQRKGRAPAEATTVVTLSKTTRSTARLHPHYARVTLNAQGAIIKMALSR
jgi:hypothetical protein